MGRDNGLKLASLAKILRTTEESLRARIDHQMILLDDSESARIRNTYPHGAPELRGGVQLILTEEKAVERTPAPKKEFEDEAPGHEYDLLETTTRNAIADELSKGPNQTEVRKLVGKLSETWGCEEAKEILIAELRASKANRRNITGVCIAALRDDFAQSHAKEILFENAKTDEETRDHLINSCLAALKNPSRRVAAKEVLVELAGRNPADRKKIVGRGVRSLKPDVIPVHEMEDRTDVQTDRFEILKEMLVEVADFDAKLVAGNCTITLGDKLINERSAEVLLEVAKKHPGEVAKPCCKALCNPNCRAYAESVLMGVSKIDVEASVKPLVGALEDDSRFEVAKRILLRISVTDVKIVIGKCMPALANAERKESVKTVLLEIAGQNKNNKYLVAEGCVMNLKDTRDDICQEMLIGLAREDVRLQTRLMTWDDKPGFPERRSKILEIIALIQSAQLKVESLPRARAGKTATQAGPTKLRTA
ncbi:MAG: hypothetical protein ABII22_01835 [Candidatus Micrarchaeota archaeon]